MAIDGPKGPRGPDDSDAPDVRDKPDRPFGGVPDRPVRSALELERTMPFGSRAAHRAHMAALPRHPGRPTSDSAPASPMRDVVDTARDLPHDLDKPQPDEPTDGIQDGQDMTAADRVKLAAKLREFVTDDAGHVLGVEGRRDGVRLVRAEQLRDLVEKIRGHLGAPDQVVETPKGTFEVWLISTRPRSAVTFRMFSRSGGMTVDFSNVPGLADVKKLHILQEGDAT